MKRNILVSVGVAMLILAALGGLAAWLGLPCGASTCGVGGWLYDFQTLLTGLVAAAAALATVFVLRLQIRQASEAAVAAIEANRINLERQIAHERELREFETRAQRQHEIDSIATILANEAEDLGVAFVHIPHCLQEMREIHHRMVHDLQDVGVMGLDASLGKFEDRMIVAEAAIKPLSIRYTKTARNAFAYMRAAKLLMESPVKGLAKYDENFDHHMEAARNLAHSIRDHIDAMKPDAD